MKTYIITDDNSGINKEEATLLGIGLVRMPIIINDDVYYENDSINEEKFYSLLSNNNNNIKTSQPSIGEVCEIFDRILKEYDQIIYIPMSSGLSSTCATGICLASNYNGKVIVIDNHRISVTLKESIYDALNLIKKGYEGNKIKEILENEASNTSIYIMVDTLTYLKKGGRITAAGALIGGALHIKPVLKINGGKLDAFAKCLGNKKAKLCMIQAIENDLRNKFKDFNINELQIAMAYTHDLEEALIFKKEVMKYFSLNDKDILMDPLSLSIGVHIGPGSLAITLSHRIY